MSEKYSKNQFCKFVVEFIDKRTGSIIDDYIIETDDMVLLCEIVGPGSTWINDCEAYDLDSVELQKIISGFSISVKSPTDIARLRSWRVLDDLPYKIHTNRELLLMLEGKKH